MQSDLDPLCFFVPWLWDPTLSALIRLAALTLRSGSCRRNAGLIDSTPLALKTFVAGFIFLNFNQKNCG